MVEVNRTEFADFVMKNDCVGHPVEAVTFCAMQYIDNDGRVVADAVYDRSGCPVYRISAVAG